MSVTDAVNVEEATTEKRGRTRVDQAWIEPCFQAYCLNMEAGDPKEYVTSDQVYACVKTYFDKHELPMPADKYITCMRRVYAAMRAAGIDIVAKRWNCQSMCFGHRMIDGPEQRIGVRYWRKNKKKLDAAAK